MAEAGKAFRTITRASILRKYLGPSDEELFAPIGLTMAPQNATINHGVGVEKLKEKSLRGAEVTALSYDQGREATISLEFAAAGVEVESLITGRVFTTRSNYTSFVYLNVRATAATLPARPAAEYTSYVAEQTAAGAALNGTYCWYINASGIAIPLTVIDYSGTPSGNQIAIGDGLALKLPTTLVDSKAEIYIKAPAEFPTAVVMSATPLDQVWITLWGTRFDGEAVRIINARNCSLNYGAELSSEPQRSIEFEILSDSSASSDLGYDIIDIPFQIIV